MSDLRKRITSEFQRLKDVLKVSEAMNLDTKIVRYHLLKEGIELPKGSYRTKSGSKLHSAPISEAHAALGAKLAFLRHEKEQTDSSEFALSIGLSSKRYNAIERGTGETTLSDLRRIAAGLQVQIWELLQPLKLK